MTRRTPAQQAAIELYRIERRGLALAHPLTSDPTWRPQQQNSQQVQAIESVLDFLARVAMLSSLRGELPSAFTLAQYRAADQIRLHILTRSSLTAVAS